MNLLNNKKYLIKLNFLFIINIMYADIFDGYTLFTPLVSQESGATTYLINNDYDILNTWSHDYKPASMPYLLPDSSIIYPFTVPFPTMEAGGVGGGFGFHAGSKPDVSAFWRKS